VDLQNNGWAVSASFKDQSPTPNVADRAPAYGMPGVVVNGQDPFEVFTATREAVQRAAAGDGPSLVEAKTLRIRGHYEGDRQRYRDDITDPDEIPEDPVVQLRALLDAEESDRMDDEARRTVDEAFEDALAAPGPDPDVIYRDVWAVQ